MARWQDRLTALHDGEPWFEPWRDAGERVAGSMAAGAPLHEALNEQGAGEPRFVSPDHLPAGMAYEQYVFDTGRCPTRDNLHDFFNGLVWLELPRAKRQLNRVQAAQIAAHGVSTRRGPVRDAATLFDENGAVLSAPEPLWQALGARDWQRLFVDLRPLWREACLLVVGHALLEKLVEPRKNLTAHVWNVPGPSGSTVQVDEWLEGQLTPERLAAKPFLPLPVLGVPGWCAENAAFSFYDDPLVFRPPP
ncbi:DUF3025 domain-containing protein [Ramlibacter sp. WS9]|uniref:DUF3025 domain-containing protein n=1 Tax=Ramlibacter sp. WS9 TaxID=1882741 RepID=UPI0018EE83BD|nr:DUF3025 domain-containing protein [Ramlibacter sp. WS9]